ncbi:MAG TPA: succinic semialdehyde dehydrogenase [Thermoleophilia bacterium]|nr:succinic semialdehyde dehydrogenase [Thermoleophilia bacterium]
MSTAVIDTTPAERQWTTRVGSAMLARLAARAAVTEPAGVTPVEAPFTGEPFGEVPKGSPADVTAAAARAREAQREWARWPAAERAELLHRFYDLVVARTPEVCDLIQIEAGKARRDAYEEILDVVTKARHNAHIVGACLHSKRRQGAIPLLTKTRELHPPRGVVGIISPWNYPFTLTIGDAIPALVAGNGVVLKPDSQTPFCALWAAEVMAEAGLPEGLLAIVPGSGAELGEPLIEAADYITFTGSTATGRLVAAQAASRIKDCSMELGGKNPLLVLPDARLGAAVRGATNGICASAGQLCISIERVYVHDAVYDRFVPRLAESLHNVRLGAQIDFSVDMGSLIGADQLAKVAGHVDDAVAKGAEVLAGGRARPDLGPYFYEPTLLAGVTDEMAVCRQETFGPVASVYRCASVDEMVARANDSPYGLSSSVWTRDGRTGRAIAERLHIGAVNINDAYTAAWASASPMGGFKTSGLGRRHGRAGLLRFTETQTVAHQRVAHLATPPFLTHEQYAKVLGLAVRAFRHVPWID